MQPQCGRDAGDPQPDHQRPAGFAVVGHDDSLCRLPDHVSRRTDHIGSFGQYVGAHHVEDLDLEHRRAPVRSKGGAIEWVYWDSGTAHLLPRLLRLPDGSTRTHGPLFLPERRPVPARRPSAVDICPHTGRARLGYDRARVLLEKYAGLDLHQLRHSAATHLGDAEVPLQLIMGKTRHKNPRTAMRYVKPGAEAVAKVTEVLAPRRRTR
ncbi:tyrosine-type recombinase/integrase [Nonomuraea sp. NPDC049028]|uniref:tyrosine-type recombinase/integrase n=1 Tax=Nonomuraea sp. NPDC049028 TaxID=3364348 RepID=UPI00371A3401